MAKAEAIISPEPSLTLPRLLLESTTPVPINSFASILFACNVPLVVISFAVMDVFNPKVKVLSREFVSFQDD